MYQRQRQSQDGESAGGHPKAICSVLSTLERKPPCALRGFLRRVLTAPETHPRVSAGGEEITGKGRVWARQCWGVPQLANQLISMDVPPSHLPGSRSGGGVGTSAQWLEDTSLKAVSDQLLPGLLMDSLNHFNIGLVNSHCIHFL